MSREREYQKSKLYAWEQEVVSPRAHHHVPFEKAQMFVDGIWMAEGLMYPPKVEPMPKQARRVWADAHRLKIRIPEDGIPAWVLIHEIAHSMTSLADGHSNGHGEDYLGTYMRLLDKHLKIPLALLLFTAQKAGLKYNLLAVFWEKR